MHVQIVAEVTIIDDSRIKLLCIRHDDLIDVLCYHTCRLAVLRVDYIFTSRTNLTKLKSEDIPYSYKSLTTAEKFFFVSL